MRFQESRGDAFLTTINKLEQENAEPAKVVSKRLDNDTAMINYKLEAQGLREEIEKLKARVIELEKSAKFTNAVLEDVNEELEK